MAEREYILGTDREELERLGSQHQAWVRHTHALFDRAGWGTGDVLLDLGCGPGFTALELARLVGPKGRVWAADVSARFLAHLTAEVARLGIEHVRTVEGPVEELDLPAASLDGVYSRWLFSWLEDPLAVLARVAGFVRPGGVLALQEYLQWNTLRLVPATPVVDRAVTFCLASFAQTGWIDVAEKLAAGAADCGLEVVDFRPAARIGTIGSPVWRWLGGFFASYLPRLVERGAYLEDDLAEFRHTWRELEARGSGAWIVAPTVGELLLRRRR